MKIKTVVVIGALAVLGFVGMLIYGVRYARHIPTLFEPPERAQLDVPLRDRNIDLATGIDPDEWADLPALDIDLIYQATIPPWPKKLVPRVEVRAFHNARDIYFYMTWPDETADRLLGPGSFSDACAIMFPLGTNAQPASIIMGFLGSSSIWHWKASDDLRVWGGEDMPEPEKVYSDYYYPFEDQETLPVMKNELDTPVADLVSMRIGTLTERERQIVEGRGVWIDGAWHVAMRRALRIEGADPETDALFGADGVRTCAFAVWNGRHGDRGGRKSISGFVALNLLKGEKEGVSNEQE